MGLSRRLAGNLQEQLQQATNREARQANEKREREARQVDEARKALEEATARELRLQQEAIEGERRQFAEARQLQEEVKARELPLAKEARKAKDAAYERELDRVLQADKREDRSSTNSGNAWKRRVLTLMMPHCCASELHASS